MSQYPATTTGFATGAEQNTATYQETTTTTAAPAVETRAVQRNNVHTSVKPLALLPILALAFSAWVLYLAGLAAMQHQCPRNSSPLLGTAGLNGVAGFSSSVLPCSKVYRWSWFCMAFEFVILLALLAVNLMGRVWHARLAFLGLFSVATLLFMLQTERFLTVPSVNAVYEGGSAEKRAWVTFVGALVLVVANILIILALGIDNTVDTTGQSAGGYGHGHGHKV